MHAVSLELLVVSLKTLLAGQGLPHLSLNACPRSLLHIPTYPDVLPAWTYRAWDTPGHMSPCVSLTLLPYVPRPSLGL